VSEVPLAPTTAAGGPAITGYFLGQCGNSTGQSGVGIPCVSGDLFNINYGIACSAAGVLTATCQFSTTSGTIVTAANTSTAGVAWGSITVTAPATAIRYLGIQFTGSTVTVVNIVYLDICFQTVAGYTAAQCGTGDFPVSGSALASYCVPEYATFGDGSVTSRRCVSSSLWVQYDGGVLNDNGRLVASDISSRTSPWNSGQSFSTISQISALKHAYDGQLPKGLYSVWVPECAGDIQFRGFNEKWQWNQPYNITQMFQPTSAGQQVRIRVVTNWEFQTHSNLYQRMESVVDPDQIALAHKILAGFPRSMENPFHFSMIGNFLKDAAKVVLGNAGKIGGALGGAFGGPAGAAMGSQLGGAVEGLSRLVL